MDPKSSEMKYLERAITELMEKNDRIKELKIEMIDDDLTLLISLTFDDGVRRGLGAQLEEPGKVSALLREQVIGSIMKTLKMIPKSNL